MRTSATPPDPVTADVATRRELIVPEPAEALAGLLDIDPPPLHDHAPLPWLWHWVYLLERRPQRDLGVDGHPAHGIPAPPGSGWLRMFAGGRVTAHRPLRVGLPATRTTRVSRTVEKTGRSGPLTFVTVRSEIEQDGALAIVDEQDIVYRPPGSARSRPAGTGDASPPPPGPPAVTLRFAVDPVVLFRFSALTYNAHRIHYDRAYVLDEGYPDLLVHGPLQALLMGELIRRTGTATDGKRFAYRLLAPTFGAQVLTVTLTPDGPAFAAEVRDGNGRITATGELTPTAGPA